MDSDSKLQWVCNSSSSVIKQKMQKVLEPLNSNFTFNWTSLAAILTTKTTKFYLLLCIHNDPPGEEIILSVGKFISRTDQEEKAKAEDLSVSMTRNTLSASNIR
ncbi:putative PTS system, ascorbate-specific IIB component SgaB [Trichinella spiralis]|uniref:putative PTS system, ascorbate-specific IIB component SgaB n=1 Tax=Trichinella spiralis TaxID=6334 RepID=UPI0001EFE76A|nr:putative PTS system, ascorbate-specific IIB component SgaB [Trichinella spiralis]